MPGKPSDSKDTKAIVNAPPASWPNFLPRRLCLTPEPLQLCIPRRLNLIRYFQRGSANISSERLNLFVLLFPLKARSPNASTT